MGKKGKPLTLLWGCSPVQPLLQMVRSFLKKLYIKLPYVPAIALPGIYPKETEVAKRWDTRTPVFIATISITDKVWKQCR